MDRSRVVARSALYVPGDQPGKLAKALLRGADAIIVDLEDAVPPDRKDAARRAVADWLAGVRPGDGEVWIRVNPGPLRDADVRAVALAAAVTGLCLAKTEGPDEVAEAAGLLASLGSAAVLSPLLESAAAVLAAPGIARAPRVARLQVGEADLAAELGIEPGQDEAELLWVRSHVVLASAAAGIDPPLGPASPNFADLAAFERSTRALRRLGYRGRACIHPAQVSVTNQVFTPAAEEVERARRVIAVAATAGGAAVADGDGTMIDEAVVRSARRVLALSEAVHPAS
ncbi:MAG TPA: CoA ester lyase [Streptosporangiaceae bacterium]|nr:CoA ester lyase [Streptosporangiaceae bacterium]